MRKIGLRWIVLPATVLTLAGVGGCSADPEPAATVTVTASPEAASAQSPTAESAAQETPEASTEVVSETFVMPSVVGMNLQDAQDTLQVLGSYVMDQQDASGMERLQINDSNWTVCTQDPAPGQEVPLSQVVTLASVKLDETCP